MFATMPSIEQDIVTWANGRPSWQRVLLERILSTDPISDEFIDSLASSIIAKTVPPVSRDLTVKDMPNSSSSGSRVELVSISEVSNVNALVSGQTLGFGDSGITIVYGDNGSGKSGYARLVKESVDARHKRRILPNAFDAPGTDDQSAVITYKVGGIAKSVSWPEIDDPDLRQIHFYDEACGNDYLVTNTELTYRPSALGLFDQLIAATDMVRAVLVGRIQTNRLEALTLTGLNPGSDSGKFVASTSSKTTDAEIDDAVDLPNKAEEALAGLIATEARLKSTDPAKEKKRLADGANQVETLADHFDEIFRLVSPAAGESIAKLINDAKAARAAADVASATDFADEPLKGVGSATWRLLWEAAESYSQAEAYPGADFPVTSNACCVFCHQPLSEDGQSRLHRFHAFVHDETAKKARAAEGLAKKAIEDLKALHITTIESTNALGFLEVEDSRLAESLRFTLTDSGIAQTRIGKRLGNETEEPFLALHAIDTDELRLKAAGFRTMASKIDAARFAGQLLAVANAKDNLADKIELAKHSTELKSETARLRRLSTMESLQKTLTTTPMTTKSNSLARDYVTKQVDDRFARESGYLGLTQVILGDQGGDKGKLKHKPALLGATLQEAKVEDVLSEGEQTALGLAGLFTEVNFDASKSAVVFDDPITSLDHGRREQVAKRIAEVAKERQVIVMTHDLTFLGDIIRSAEEQEVPVLERSIIRTNQQEPGQVLLEHPWKAKDAKKRIGDLRDRLAKLKKNQKVMTPSDYERDSRMWAGDLSETWERMVRNDVVGKVVDRGTTEVRPRMIKLLARITPQDNTDFQAGYSQVSKWAARHDKSEDVNFVAPTTTQMEAELDRADAWQKRVADYANKA